MAETNSNFVMLQPSDESDYKYPGVIVAPPVRVGIMPTSELSPPVNLNEDESTSLVSPEVASEGNGERELTRCSKEDDSSTKVRSTEASSPIVGSSGAYPAGSTLMGILAKLEGHAATIPDSVANHYLQQAGFESGNPRLARLLSLATETFISDILNEALTRKLREDGNETEQGKAEGKRSNTTLTVEDIQPILSLRGITVKKPPYHI